MNAEDYEAYRNRAIEEGKVFQDYVMEQCLKLMGLQISCYSSRKSQFNTGESMGGVEIKNDRSFATTGRLYFEIAEKARPRDGDYVPSGICRGDKSWLYLIGNCDIFFIFAVAHLREVFQAGKYPTIENRTKTSRGFLMPECDAKRLATHILRPNSPDPVEHRKFENERTAAFKQLLKPRNANQQPMFDFDKTS